MDYCGHIEEKINTNSYKSNIYEKTFTLNCHFFNGNV